MRKITGLRHGRRHLDSSMPLFEDWVERLPLMRPEPGKEWMDLHGTQIRRSAEYQQLLERLGEAHFRQRFNLQVEHASQVFWRGRTLFHIENVDWLMVALSFLLRLTGLSYLGRRNVRNIQILRHTFHSARLPFAFDGFRILHLSDLHLDLDPSLTDVIADKVSALEYDLCVITGDYRNSTSGPYDSALRETARLVRTLRHPVYGILGNHDFIEFVPGLEASGMRMLLNESVQIRRGDETICVSGVDDPHFYETHDLQKALSGIPAETFSILLVHTPELYRVAAACGYDLMLCGHTHGGQICLPGGVPILTNAGCPRWLARGYWSYQDLHGYTSAGTGSAGVPARFFCPPEITLHRLCRIEGEDEADSARRPSEDSSQLPS